MRMIKLVGDGGGEVHINIDTVTAIESEGDVTYVFTTGGHKHVVGQPLNEVLGFIGSVLLNPDAAGKSLARSWYRMGQGQADENLRGAQYVWRPASWRVHPLSGVHTPHITILDCGLGVFSAECDVCDPHFYRRGEKDTIAGIVDDHVDWHRGEGRFSPVEEALP